jgi:hypothetical protein
MPKNKFLRLLINIVLIVAWYIFTLYFFYFCYLFLGLDVFDDFSNKIGYVFSYVPMFFITRYIWFEKSRDRIFYGLFDKLNIHFKKFEPRIYTTKSNADKIKKYALLRNQGIITEEEF